MRTACFLALLAAGCASAGAQRATGPAPSEATSVDRVQYPSTYRRRPNPPVLIRNATLTTATGQEIPGGSRLEQFDQISLRVGLVLPKRARAAGSQPPDTR